MKEGISTKKLVTMAMIAAVAYLFMVIVKVPLVPAVSFLQYDAQDCIIALGGFIYGPVPAFIISVVVAFIEMITVSDTGIIGFIMNVVSNCAFVLPAAFIYKKQHNMKGAIIGLVVGCVTMVGIMMLWNYLVTPIYMGCPREVVASLLLPGFLPFNLIKGGLNVGFTLLIYKPVVTVLRKANLVEVTVQEQTQKDYKFGYAIASSLVLITCVLSILVFNQAI